MLIFPPHVDYFLGRYLTRTGRTHRLGLDSQSLLQNKYHLCEAALSTQILEMPEHDIDETTETPLEGHNLHNLKIPDMENHERDLQQTSPPFLWTSSEDELTCDLLPQDYDKLPPWASSEDDLVRDLHNSRFAGLHYTRSRTVSFSEGGLDEWHQQSLFGTFSFPTVFQI